MLIRPTQTYSNPSCRGTFLNNPELQNYMKKSSTVELFKFKNILERMNKVDDGLVYFFRETVQKKSKQDSIEITCFSKDKTGSPNRVMRFIPQCGYLDVLGEINRQFTELYPETVKNDKSDIVNGINKLLLDA